MLASSVAFFLVGEMPLPRVFNSSELKLSTAFLILSIVFGWINCIPHNRQYLFVFSTVVIGSSEQVGFFLSLPNCLLSPIHLSHCLGSAKTVNCSKVFFNSVLSYNFTNAFSINGIKNCLKLYFEPHQKSAKVFIWFCNNIGVLAGSG